MRAVGVTKRYRVYSRPLDRLREMLLASPRHAEFPALSEISFELPSGGSLALLGENGAGKSTLLRLIVGVSQPTSGRVEVRGRVGALLELGSGFHPDFTGRQNAQLAATLYGLSAQELHRKLPEILEWAELGKFVDRPLRQYSTGMAMRLGFSVAIHVDPDILVVDEALAVGDGYFQKKCVDRILEFQRRGGTLLFCTHALYYASTLCNRALWLRNGRVERIGPATEVVRAYEEFLLERPHRDAGAEEESVRQEPAANLARIVALEVEAPESNRLLRQPDSPLRVRVRWESQNPCLRFHVAIGIEREPDQLPLAAFATHYDELPALEVGKRGGCLELELLELPFVQGRFHLTAFLLDEHGLHVYDRRNLTSAFRIEPRRFHPGLVDIPHRWRLVCDSNLASVLELTSSYPSPPGSGEACGGQSSNA